MPPPDFIRLSELTGLIQETIYDAFEGRSYWVVADVTSHSFKAQDERHFFVLAEKREGSNSIVARAETVAWRSASWKIKDFEIATGQKFQSGIHVLVKVAVSYNPEYGLKLTLLDIDVNFTIGALEQQKQDILKRLETECPDYIRKEGDKYITRNNLLHLNPVIQKIALVCSNATAGYEDFIHTVENNPYGYSFFIDRYFTPVQGENNSYLLKQTLIDIFNSRKPYHAVVIIRGGGAQTDFLIFETFGLGQAVAKFPIPIITGIGHQRNETIVDMMAHSPTKTPTKAAEYIIAHNRCFEEAVLNAQNAIIGKSQQQFMIKYQALNPVISNIRNYSRIYLQSQKGQIEHFISLFKMMDPENILRKGFAIIYHKGRIISGLAHVQPGDQVAIATAEFEIEASVTSKKKRNGSEFKL